MKLFDSELKVMNVLWSKGSHTAKEISDILKAETGWNMNATYTRQGTVKNNAQKSLQGLGNEVSQQ